MNRLKELRVNARIPVQDLAKRFGVSRQYIYQIENADHEPSIHILKQYAQFFHVSFEYLLGEDTQISIPIYNCEMEPIGSIRLTDQIMPCEDCWFGVQRRESDTVVICEKCDQIMLGEPGIYRFKGKYYYSSLKKDENGHYILVIDGIGPQYVSSLNELDLLGYSKYQIIRPEKAE